MMSHASKQAVFCEHQGWTKKAQNWRYYRWQMWVEDNRRFRAGKNTGYYQSTRVEVNF